MQHSWFLAEIDMSIYWFCKESISTVIVQFQIQSNNVDFAAQHLCHGLLDWIILSPFFRYIAGYLIYYNNILPGMLYIIIIFCWVCNPKRLWSVFLILTLLCTKLWDMKEGKKNCTKISNTKKTSNVWSSRWQNLINELYNATWKLVYNVFPPIHLPTSHLTPNLIRNCVHLSWTVS